MAGMILGNPSVFPACAGVIPGCGCGCGTGCGIPRVCGGDPSRFRLMDSTKLYSPRVRG